MGRPEWIHPDALASANADWMDSHAASCSGFTRTESKFYVEIAQCGGDLPREKLFYRSFQAGICIMNHHES